MATRCEVVHSWPHKMVNTGSGVATVSTDGCSGTGKVLNNAICTMCGAIQYGVTAMIGATTRLGANGVDA